MGHKVLSRKQGGVCVFVACKEGGGRGRGPSPKSKPFFFFFFFLFSYYAFIVFMYEKPLAALAMDRTKPTKYNQIRKETKFLFLHGD